MQLRDGTYPAYADYAGIGGDDVDERENMTGVRIGEVDAYGQDFAVTGIQHEGARLGAIWLYDQTYVQGIDSHTLYMTGRRDPVYGAICRDLYVAAVGGRNCRYSMPFKMRDVVSGQVAAVAAFGSAGAVLIASRCRNITFDFVASLDQVENEAEELAPAPGRVGWMQKRTHFCDPLRLTCTRADMRRLHRFSTFGRRHADGFTMRRPVGQRTRWVWRDEKV